MSSVQVRNLTKRFGTHAAMFEVTFDLPAGEAVVLLGPAGSGKSMILQCLAGLETPDSGTIHIDGQPMFDLDQRIDVPPERRGFGIVFQSHALWPHMTVAENVAFPLKARGVPEMERLTRAGQMLAMIGLPGFDNRSSTLLSGAQRPRVALARALIHRPPLVLFDDALSHLEPAERRQLRMDLLDLRQKLGFTAIHATNDHSEAFGLADRIILMNGGAIDSIAPAREMFRQPRNAFAARFFDMNVLEGRLIKAVPDSSYLEVELSDRLVVRGVAAPDAELPIGGRVLACIRRDAVRLLRPERLDAAAAVIETVSFQGAEEDYVVNVAGILMRATGPAVGFVKGEPVDVTMTPGDWVFVR